jgi:GMP synthase-like glutamine amidotransferase
MKILIIQNCETERFGYFEEYLVEKNIDFNIFPAYRNKDFPNVKDYSAFMVGGSPISAIELEDHGFLRKEYEFLKNVVETGLPCFGMCFGGQILARILGAKVRRNHKKEIGGYEVDLTEEGKNNRFFEGFSDNFPVFQWHQDTFDIPEGAQLLVTGKDCINQAFSYRNIIGVQFHLEVHPDEAAKWAENYSDELLVFNKSREQVVSECRVRSAELKTLSYRLMDNFLSIIHE